MLAFDHLSATTMVSNTQLSPYNTSRRLDRDQQLEEEDRRQGSHKLSQKGKDKARPRRDDFVAVKLLGRGSIGTVIKVMHKGSGNVYAMKVIHKDHIEKNGLRSQLLAEVRIQMTLRHVNLLRCFNYFEDADRVFLVLELATGGDLYQYLKRGALPQEDAAENIMLGRDLQAKIADFGCVSQKQSRNTLCGTACILAPEMITG
eukprot:CAMPEP_0178454892 /NCGR_PEP_ID=MMETSP0689_2-20121128/45614_1 /TAXON_ID=160604 /ORGANISM="Amphidinium massartii, Strain CS-259" /LENGTH=202 /DNA_ID=CAMNT_0020080883 /DNA_START=93 /DNA_END=698 /DNA_ORIENTATION=-